MNLNEFTQKVQAALKAVLDADIQTIETLKLNGVRLHGLIIRERGDTASPTIYLENYYNRYLATRNLPATVTALIGEYQHSKLKKDMDTEWLKDFHHVKNRICYTLINYDANRELLRSIPHKKFLDLAKIYYVLCQVEEKEGHIIIHSSHLDLWETTADELDCLAETNTPLLQIPALKSPYNVLGLEEEPELPEKTPESDPSVLSDMYILTNRQHFHGAAVMCYQGPLEAFSRRTGRDTVILPSCIHDIILLPLTGETDLESLKHMVKDINATQVEPTERLSDSVYIYRKDTMQIEIA